MSSNSLLAELEAAVKSGSPEKRVETLRRVTGLFLGESDRLNEQQIGVFDDVLVHLVERIEAKALVQLSETLAPIGNAPVETIRRLSSHDDIMVAGPVLAQSTRLSESDLVDLAKRKGQGHLLAISGRASLPEVVTDVLVERGEAPVHRALATNPGARFSQSGFSSLMKNAQNDDGLAEKLGLRLDIPFELLRQLLARATDLVRSRLLASASPKNHERITQALASVINEIRNEAVTPHDFVRADNIVLELNQKGKLNEAVLVKFIEGNQYEEMTATLALFCGVKSELIERLLKNVRHEGLILACKAAKLSWSTTSLILRSRFSHHSISEQELIVAKDSFLELSQAAAQRSLRFMQVQKAIKEAG
jgi:uncharacterized protein (DUF2336 family)